jgi:transcription elongation factor Elf1
MNYKILKNIVENLLQSFACPSCTKKIEEAGIEIVWAAGNSLNLNIICSECDKCTMVRTEVANINLWKLNWLNIPEEIKSKIKNLKSEISTPTETKIKDEEIISLNKKLKWISWVEELFSQK